MKQKVIFLDVDGTLVNYYNELPKSASEAIKAAQANGHLVYVVTGRSKAEMYDYILDIGFDGYIGGNGNYIESNDEVLMHRTLSGEHSQQIVDWLHRRQLEFYLESNAGLFGSEHFEKRGQQTMIDYTLYKESPDTSAMTVRKAFPNMIFDAPLYREDINKISFILESYQDFLDAKERFADFKVITWGGAGKKALFGDIALQGINKSTAIEILLTHLNIDKQDTLAFGDAAVDIPMLELCEIGVAMGNCGIEIKAMADYITTDVDQDGIKNAFQHFGLIE